MPEWQNHLALLEIGHSIGKALDVLSIIPWSGIPTVQLLVPRHDSECAKTLYSGTYGLRDFPLHTDLAHWSKPPRYFVLRCIVGAKNVFTRLLPSSALLSTLGMGTLRRALVRSRRPARSGVHCLLPLVFSAEDSFGLRWDPLFLIPMNQAARQMSEVMSTESWDRTELLTFALTKPGDTLIVDNWRYLHGRSNVSSDDMSRCLERIYVSEIRT